MLRVNVADWGKALRQRINTDPWAIADRLWVKDALDPDEEKLRIRK